MTTSTSTTSAHDRRSDDSRGLHERDTFLSGQDVLNRVRAALERLGDTLREQSEGPAYPALATTLEILERERLDILSNTLVDFEETSPNEALEHTQQYFTVLPPGLSKPPETRSPQAIAAWMSAMTDRFATAFDELATGCESDRVAEPFARMAVRMRAHARRIARISIEAVETGPPVSRPAEPDGDEV